MNSLLPEYSTFYKFLLVEELALCSDPARIHYGKCWLLGYLLQPDTLGSLTIPNIQKQYQVPDCTYNVKLKSSFNTPDDLNSTVEVFGEVRLFDDALGPDSPLESSHSLMTRLIEFDEHRGDPAKTDSSVVRYKPVLEVHTIRHVKEARELIAKNLQFRIIQAKRKALQRTK